MVKQWGDVKDEIRTLYLNERLPLGDVQAYMKNNYGWSASIRAYRSKLRDWGFKRSDNKAHKRSSNRCCQKSTAVTADRPVSPHGLTDASIDASIHLVEYMPSLSSTSKSTDASLSGSQLSQYSRTPSSIDSPVIEGAIDIDQPALQDQFWLNDPQLYVENIPTLVSQRISLQQEHHFSDTLTKNGEQAKVHNQNDSGVEDGLGQFNQLQDEISHDTFRQGSLLMLAEINHSQTQLHLPARSGSRFGVYHVLESIFPHQAVESQDDNGDTSLHRAMLANPPDYVVIQLLLESGSHVNKPNHRSLTPFHLLCMQAPVGEISIYLTDVFTLFLDHGADVNGPIAGGRSPFQRFILAFKSLKFCTAGFRDSFPVLAQFLEQGADPDTDIWAGESLLEYFMKDNTLVDLRHDSCLNVIKLLCERSDVDRMKRRAYHPLHEVLRWISKSYYTKALKEILGVLLARGVDVNQQSSKELPLAMVFKYGTGVFPVLDIATLLLDAGANPLRRTCTGELIIYAALRVYRDTKSGLAALFLEAIATQEHDVYFPPNLNPSMLITPSRETIKWWRRTKTLLNSKFWHFAKDHMTDPKHVLPIDTREVIIKTALERIGRSCVDYYKSQFNKCKSLGNYKEMISHGDCIIWMLTDFRTLEIFPGENWRDLSRYISSEMVAHME